MAGTIVVDRLESDASYASSINVASPMVVSNTLTMASSSRMSGSIILGSTRSANTTSKIEVSEGADVGLLVRQTSNVSYAGMRFFNATDNPGRALEIDYSSPGYTGPLVSGGPTGEAGSITTTGTYPLTLGTNNTARVIVDANGRVTLPNQPAFSVKHPGSNVSGVQIFTGVYVNNGSHYNTSNGRFTAPVAGRYYFYFQALANPGNSDVRYLINGGAQAVYAESNETTYKSISFGIIFSLNANDYVQVDFFNGSNYGQDYSNFCGYLIG